MQIAQKIAGFSFGGADIMRRAIAKKKLEILEKQRNIFLFGGKLDGDKTGKYVPGAVANGVSEEIANHLFDQILKFASYAFNKSHAAAYTFLTYQTAYLKLYYPIHFIVAVVNNRITNADEVKHYMNYLKRTGVKTLPPDINRSQKNFSIEGENVRYGLMGIKNVGEQAMEYVLTERREHGKFKDIRDLLDRCAGQINKRMLESLIKGGALDSFGKTRSTLMASYERIMDTVLCDKKSKVSGQMSLFDELIEDTEIKYTEVEEYPKSQILAFEKEVLGMYLSGHPLDDYNDAGCGFDFDTSMIYTEEADEDGNVNMVVDQNLANRSVKFGCIVSSFDKKLTSKQQKFAVGRVEDRMGSIAFSMFPRAYETYGELLAGDLPLKVYGKIDLRDESEPKVNIERAEIWQNSSFKASGQNNGNGVLYVLIENGVQKDMVVDILELYPGNTICQAQVVQSGKPKLMQFAQKVAICDELLMRLQNILGEKHVKYCEKK